MIIVAFVTDILIMTMGQEECSTIGGTVPEGTECALPFIYQNKTYTRCIKNGTREWCSTTFEYKGEWGNCLDCLRVARGMENVSRGIVIAAVSALFIYILGRIIYKKKCVEQHDADAQTWECTNCSADNDSKEKFCNKCWRKKSKDQIFPSEDSTSIHMQRTNSNMQRTNSHMQRTTTNSQMQRGNSYIQRSDSHGLERTDTHSC